MNKKTNIMLSLLALLLWNCNAYQPIAQHAGKTVEGKIIDGSSGGFIIGQSVVEFDRPSNHTLTDTLGNFELRFLGNHPIIKLTGFYEPLFMEINPKAFNHIVLDAKTIRSSKKTFNKITQLKKKKHKKYAKIPLLGTWEVIAINKSLNPQWQYLNEIEPGSTDKRLSRLFPSALKEGDLLKFEVDKKLMVNSEKEYRFGKGKNHLSIGYSDMVYGYTCEFIDKNTLSFRKEITIGEFEWVIKRI